VKPCCKSALGKTTCHRFELALARRVKRYVHDSFQLYRLALPQSRPEFPLAQRLYWRWPSHFSTSRNPVSELFPVCQRSARSLGLATNDLLV
jgi:hypothetical protein